MLDISILLVESRGVSSPSQQGPNLDLDISTISITTEPPSFSGHAKTLGDLA